jgi:hypothetical protein
MAGVDAQLVRVSLRRTASRCGLAAILLSSSAACTTGSTTQADCSNAVPTPAISTTGSDQPPPIPITGAYLGAAAFTGSLYTEARRIASVDALEQAICRPLDIVHTYVTWQAEFPTASQLAASRDGQILLMSWTGTDTREMASGADDAEIRRIAGAVAGLHTPFFVELRWEMERPNLAGIVHSPADFIAAWDRARAIFDEVGVTNASWVWCPTATGFDNGTAPAYYPGAKEVDWICTDAYPQPPGAYEDLQSEVGAFMRWAAPQGKPIMLGEVGVPLSYSVERRNQWLDRARAYLTSTPAIKAFVYFDLNPIGHATSRDWLLPAGSEALQHFRALANDPWFSPRTAATTQPTSG